MSECVQVSIRSQNIVLNLKIAIFRGPIIYIILVETNYSFVVLKKYE